MKNKLFKNIKTITSYTLASLIVVLSFGFSPVAQAIVVVPTITIGSQIASSGDTINVPVDASNFANTVAGMDFSVQYDSTLLTYTGLTQNAISGNGLLTTNQNANPIPINWFDSAALNINSGTILTLNFTVISETTTDANLTVVGLKEIVNVTGDVLTSSFIDGVISLNLDTIAPVITPHDDVTAEATSSNGAIVNYTAPNATDNVDETAPAVCLPASGSLFTLGLTEITCNKTDSSGNEADSTTFDVIAEDTTAPVITLNGDAVIDLIVGDTYNESGATASDTVDGNLTEGEIDVGGDTVDTSTPGVYVITYDVSDEAGNNATQVTRTVNVSDTSAPVVDTAPDITEEATGPSGAVVTYDESALTATDDVEGTISVDEGSCLPASGSTFVLGTTPVSCSATDSSNNEGNGVAFNVIVEDTTAPVITLNGSAIMNITVGDTYNEEGATASDGVDGTDPVTIGGDTVITDTPATFTITYDAVDAAGNNATQIIRTVNVNAPAPDTTAPVITLTGDSTMSLATDQTFTDPGATASDNVDGDITANIVVAGDTVDASTPGTYVITYNVSDEASNPATEVTRTVIVSDLEISAEQQVEPTSDNITITWTTTHPATSRVIYDTVSHNPVVDLAPNYGYANSTTEDTNLVTDHSVTVSGLSSSTIYFFRPVSHGSPETYGEEVSVATSAPRSGGGGGGGGRRVLGVSTSNDGCAPGNLFSTTTGEQCPVDSTVILGCDNRTTGFSVTTGQSCVGNTGTTSTIGQALGAEHYNFTLFLKMGSCGNEVMELQKFLNVAVFSTLVVDGKFGLLTKTAVIKFQLANGLKGDGVIGPMTRKALNA